MKTFSVHNTRLWRCRRKQTRATSFGRPATSDSPHFFQRLVRKSSRCGIGDEPGYVYAIGRRGSMTKRSLVDLEGPLKLCVEARALVAGQCPVVSLPPGELEPHTEGLIHIPEQVAIESAVADFSRGGDVAVDRIVDPVADVAVQARRPVEKTFQPAFPRRPSHDRCHN